MLVWRVNMRNVIYVKLDIVYSINHQQNETISRKSIFWNSEIESDNLTVWNSEIITFDFTEKSL